MQHFSSANHIQAGCTKLVCFVIGSLSSSSDCLLVLTEQQRQSVNLARGALMYQDAAAAPVQTSTWWSPRPSQVCLHWLQSLANLSKLYSCFEIL